MDTGFDPRRTWKPACHFPRWARLQFDTRRGRFDRRLRGATRDRLWRLWKRAKRCWINAAGKMWRCHRFVSASALLRTSLLKRHRVFLIGFSPWTQDWSERRGEHQPEPCMHTSDLCLEPVIVSTSGDYVQTPLSEAAWGDMMRVEKTRIRSQRQARHLAFLFVALATRRAPIVHHPSKLRTAIARLVRATQKPISAPAVRTLHNAYVVVLHTLGAAYRTTHPGLVRWSISLLRDGTLAATRTLLGCHKNGSQCVQQSKEPCRCQVRHNPRRLLPYGRCPKRQ